MVHLPLVTRKLIFSSFPAPLRKAWVMIIAPYPASFCSRHTQWCLYVFLCSVAIGDWRNYFFLPMLATLVFNVLIFSYRVCLANVEINEAPCQREAVLYLYRSNKTKRSYIYNLRLIKLRRPVRDQMYPFHCLHWGETEIRGELTFPACSG